MGAYASVIRRGLKPIIFVLNNNGYLIERLLCADPDIAYNDVPSWDYPALPKALGCTGWYTARATTCKELDEAMARARNHDGAAYIEVVTDKYAASPLASACTTASLLSTAPDDNAAR